MAVLHLVVLLERLYAGADIPAASLRAPDHIRPRDPRVRVRAHPPVAALDAVRLEEPLLPQQRPLQVPGIEELRPGRIEPSDPT
eukprot:CAMPEP_0114509764 /NCGR_PEP_ID=MMETSP0109-20121206/13395_1 /TAXON_ID=29199 /ORGANISM="Chlorarachnion reptans, Strain CCCM449" /LENGTH=83 /DNA_ID=CAMNT_0001688961 /DNA_START=637 /DNA_END=885 /DNA_ORIENTATION=-